MRVVPGDVITFGGDCKLTLKTMGPLTLKPVTSDIQFRPWGKKPPKDYMVETGKGKDFKAPEFPVMLDGESVTVGSDASCDVVIPLVFISAKHAKVEKKQGKIMVTDLGSTNGTAVRAGITASPVDCVANEAAVVPTGGYVVFGSADEYAVYNNEPSD